MVTLDSRVASEVERLDAKVKRDVKIGKWQADFVLETPSKGTFIFEVKNRMLGIPDVLSTASIVNNLGCAITTFPGIIVTPEPPSEPVLQAADLNDIAIITPRRLRSKTLFISKVVEIEALGRRLLGLKPTERISFRTVVEKLHNKQIINETLCDRIKKIWNLRNKIMHGQKTSAEELRTGINETNSIQNALLSRAR